MISRFLKGMFVADQPNSSDGHEVMNRYNAGKKDSKQHERNADAANREMRPAIAIQPDHLQFWAMHSSSLGLRMLTCLGCLVLALPFATPAQTSATAPLPASLSPGAQQALKGGVTAEQRQDYGLAIRYFQDARTLAPRNPETYKDLALAESKIPGQELRAIAWFGAYLAVNPDAKNEPGVKEQIDVLVVRSRSNISRLIKAMHDAASQTGPNQGFQLGQIAGLWAEAGDVTAAMKAADSIQDPYDKDVALDNVAEGQIKAGDIAGALKTNDSIKDVYVKSLMQKSIAEAQVMTGDLAGAKKTADLIQDAHWRSEAQRSIADAQARAGSSSNSASALAIARAPVQPAILSITVYDWLNRLDDSSIDDECALDADPFLDLAAYLTSQNTDDSRQVFYTLYDTAEQLVKAQNVIQKMLEQQLGS